MLKDLKFLKRHSTGNWQEQTAAMGSIGRARVCVTALGNCFPSWISEGVISKLSLKHFKMLYKLQITPFDALSLYVQEFMHILFFLPNSRLSKSVEREVDPS